MNSLFKRKLSPKNAVLFIFPQSYLGKYTGIAGIIFNTKINLFLKLFICESICFYLYTTESKKKSLNEINLESEDIIEFIYWYTDTEKFIDVSKVKQ